MKGLLVSLVIFVGYVVSTAVLAHILKPKRHPSVLFPPLAVWCPLYFVLYACTPADFYLLSPAWMAAHGTLDLVYGFVVFLLNAHSYIDYFFGFNSGFSTSVMQRILGFGPRGATTDEIVAAYIGPDGVDKIHGWRLPRLAEKGYVTIDDTAKTCRLTPRGECVAKTAVALKRFLNLGVGG